MDKSKFGELQVNFTREGNWINVTSELSCDTSPSLYDAIIKDIVENEVTMDVSVDLSDVPFIDSTGLRLLLMVKDHVHASGKSFILGPVSPSVSRTLQLSGFEKDFTIVERLKD